MNIKCKMCRLFLRQDKGAIALMFAMMLPVIIGFVGMGVEVGLWYSAKRSLQSAADAAAIAAAYEVSSGSSAATIASAAQTDAVRNGFDTAIGTITLNVPPTSGAYVGQANAVEVLVSEPRQTLFAAILTTASVTIVSRAVALSGGDGDACVLALNTTKQKAMEFSGNSNINATGCVVASNSSHSSSIEITGSGTVTSDSLSSVGGYSTQGAATLNTVTAPQTNASAFTDPYAGIDVPAYSACDQSEYKNTPSDTATITPYSTTVPYVFCNGLDIKGTLNLSPGIYVIDGGTFNLNAGAALTGTNVSIILTSSTGSNYAKYTMNGTASVNLTAPTTGDYSGVLMYGDRNGPYQVNTLNGNASATFNGALYFPSSLVQFEGNSSLGGSSCTQIIADTVKITGSTGITTTGCVSAGATLAKPSGAQLVE